MELLVQAGVSLVTVLAGGRIIMNGINKDLTRHEKKIDRLTVRVSGIAEQVAFIRGEIGRE